MKMREVQQRGASAERNALRRTTQTGVTAEPDLQAVHDLADELGAIPERLGTAEVTPADDDEGTEVDVVVDPEATSRAEVTLSALDKEGEVPEPVRAPAARLRGSLGRQAALLGCQSAAAQLGEDLADTERWAAQGEGKAQGEFFRLLDGYLDGSLGQLSAAQRDQLRAAAAPILRLQKEATAGVSAEADKTRTAGAEAAAIVEAAAREAHMMETARDLRDDRAVDPADLATAIDTFQALGSGQLQ